MSEEVGKIFVGGVDRNTHPDAFRSYFEKFGKVSDLILMPDKERHGQNKGFGFVTYQDPSCINDIVSRKDHMLDGKELDVKPCRARGSEQRRGGGGGGGGDQRTRKVFVGGISQQASKEDLAEVFSKYGHVEDVHIMTDNDTGKHRGFGFVTLDSEEAVEKLVRMQHVELKGKSMEIKKAQPKQNRGGFGGPGGQMGGGGGYQGGGGGSWNQGGQGGYGASGNGYGGGNQYGGPNQWNQGMDPYGQQRGGNQGYGGQQQQGGYNNGYRQQQQGYSQQPQQAPQQSYGGKSHGGGDNYGAERSQSGPPGYNNYGGYGMPQQDPYGQQQQQQQQQYGNQGSMGNYAQEASGYGPQRGNYNQGYGQGQQQPQQPQQAYGQADGGQDYSNYGKPNMGGNQFHPYSR